MTTDGRLDVQDACQLCARCSPHSAAPGDGGGVHRVRTSRFRVTMSLSREFELKFLEKGQSKLVGVDEAGRGPLAGPVVAAACFIPQGVDIQGINDSKKICEEERERIFKALTSDKRIQYGIAFVDHKQIEKINILQAAMLAMDNAVNSSGVDPDVVLVDGPRLPNELKARGNAVPVVRGDSKSYSIAAASVLAKVSRDRYMLEMDARWPEYGFKRHKGYGTAEHVRAISENGPCPIHRMTFNPIKSWFPDFERGVDDTVSKQAPKKTKSFKKRARPAPRASSRKRKRSAPPKTRAKRSRSTSTAAPKNSQTLRTQKKAKHAVRKSGRKRSSKTSAASTRTARPKLRRSSRIAALVARG